MCIDPVLGVHTFVNMLGEVVAMVATCEAHAPLSLGEIRGASQ